MCNGANFAAVVTCRSRRRRFLTTLRSAGFAGSSSTSLETTAAIGSCKSWHSRRASALHRAPSSLGARADDRARSVRRLLPLLGRLPAGRFLLFFSPPTVFLFCLVYCFSAFTSPCVRPPSLFSGACEKGGYGFRQEAPPTPSQWGCRFAYVRARRREDGKMLAAGFDAEIHAGCAVIRVGMASGEVSLREREVEPARGSRLARFASLQASDRVRDRRTRRLPHHEFSFCRSPAAATVHGFPT